MPSEYEYDLERLYSIWKDKPGGYRAANPFHAFFAGVLLRGGSPISGEKFPPREHVLLMQKEYRLRTIASDWLYQKGFITSKTKLSHLGVQKRSRPGGRGRVEKTL